MLDILDCVQYNFVKAQAKMIVTDKEVCVMNTITHDFVIAPGAGIKKKTSSMLSFLRCFTLFMRGLDIVIW